MTSPPNLTQTEVFGPSQLVDWQRRSAQPDRRSTGRLFAALASMFKKAAEIADVLQQPGGVSAVLAARPRSLTSFRIASQLRTEQTNYRTIIDGGANVGQFARAAHSVFPAARILSFEPLPDVAELLRQNLADADHQVYQSALGSIDGDIRFHRTSYSQSSSALKSNTTGLLEDMREVECLTVPIARLDTILSDVDLQPPVLLKLDLQGYELEALKGAKSTLSRCRDVLLEAVFEPSYHDEPLFDEVWAHLRSQGFHFRRALNFLRDRRGHIAQIDALFRNSFGV